MFITKKLSFYVSRVLLFFKFIPVVITDKNVNFLHKIFSIIDFSVSQYTEFSTGCIQKCGVPLFDKVASPETS